MHERDFSQQDKNTCRMVWQQAHETAMLIPGRGGELVELALGSGLGCAGGSTCRNVGGNDRLGCQCRAEVLVVGPR